MALLALFIVVFILILPLLNVVNAIIPLSIFGAIGISLSGFYALLYYKSWKKDFIEKIGKPKFDLQTYFLISTLPTVLLYFIISWNFINGSGHNLYKLHYTYKVIKSLIP